MHHGPVGTDPVAEAPFLEGITHAQGAALFRTDIATYVAAVNANVTVPLNQSQFDALTDFTYNVGPGSVANSTLLQRVNAGAGAQDIADAFMMWHRGGPGIIVRRTAEINMFNNGVYP